MVVQTSRSEVVTDLLNRVERIRPVLERCRGESEANRRLSDEAYDVMLAEGLFRLQVPKAFGGMELHPADSYQVYLAVSRIDSAAGWNLQIGAAAAGFGVWLPAEGTAEIYSGGPDVIAAGTFFPPAAAIRVLGGWRVTGRTSFASGADRASWLAMPAVEMDGDMPKVDAATGQPAAMIAFFPRSDVTIHDTWHTMGMRGTGSQDIEAKDAFVPDHRIGVVGPIVDPAPAFRGPLYRLFPWHGVHGEAIPSIASAECAIDALVELAATKVANFTAGPLADRELVQHHIGKARGLVGAAKAYVFDSINRAYATLEAGGTLLDKEKSDCQLAGCFAAEASAQAVDLVHEAAGSSGFRLSQPFERYFRDVHTLTQHASKSVNRYTSVGKLELGLPQDWFALQL